MGFGRLMFLIAPLFLTLVLPTNASTELARGSLGNVLAYIIEAPAELKVGVDTPINFTFQNIGSKTIFIHGIWIWIYGAGINSTGTGISKLVAKEVELHPSESINETISVKPVREGVVNLSVHAEYTLTDFYGNTRSDWGEDTIFVYARILTLNDFKNIRNELMGGIYLLSAISVGLMIITAYLVKKLKMKQKQPLR